MKVQKPDFSGWATRANLLCSDGLTIRSGAFKKDHQKTVPLVWDHRRDDSDNVVGKAVLSYNDDGVRAKGYFNDTDRAKNLKVALQHGDLIVYLFMQTIFSSEGMMFLMGISAKSALLFREQIPELVLTSLV